MNFWLPGRRMRWRGRLGVWYWHVHVAVFKTENQRGWKYLKKKKQCKKIPSEQKPQPNRIGKPEGGALTPWDNSRAQNEDRLSQWKATTRVYSCPSTSVSLYKSVHVPFLCGDLPVAHQGGRPQIAVLSCSQINPSLLEKYLIVYSFQVSKGYSTLHGV